MKLKILLVAIGRRIMKSKTLTVLAIAALGASVLPSNLAAQSPKYPRYKLVDVGTFGGPNALVNGPTIPILSSNGTYAGEAETDIPDPFAPFCQSPDCLVTRAQEWRNGKVIDLGTLPGVNLSSGSTWVSADGIIGGESENGLIDPLLGIPEMRAVIWINGQIIDLGTLGGGYESFVPAVNDFGVVAGWSLNLIPDPYSMFGGGTTQMRGFIWWLGVKQDLGTLGGPDTSPEAINDLGQIVGTSYSTPTPSAGPGYACPEFANPLPQDPFFWENGKMVDMGGLGGTCGVAIGINNEGQVIGVSNLAGDQTHHGFLWYRGKLKDLGTLGGANSTAYWITDSGLIVGRADFSMQSSDHHAYLLKNGVMTDLGVLAPWPCSTAYAVNTQGQVVGDTGICGEGGGPSFFWQEGLPMVDINSLVLPGSDLEVVDANDINDRGEIAGVGLLPNGDQHAVLLIPAHAEEIAAADALNPSQPTSKAVHTFIRNSESSAFGGRNRMLNMYRRTHQLP
jgi:probable HAF family extracellular repeat protein